MSDLELALRKQRLILKSAALRRSMSQDAEPLQPIGTGIDKLTAGVLWVKDHPQVLAAAAAVLLVARPRRAWRWSRRGFVAWKAWQKLRDLAQP